MKPDQRARLYMTNAHVGAAATAILIAAPAFDWPDYVETLTFTVLVASVILLLRRRLRDEYIEELWNAGVTVAFVALLVWYVLAPFFHGVVEVLFDLEERQGLPVDWTGLVAIAAFFVGFHYKWLAQAR